MLRIIKADRRESEKHTQTDSNNRFVDVSEQLADQLERAKREADRMIQTARQQSEQIRSEAERLGREQAERCFQQRVSAAVQQELASVQPALQEAIESLERSHSQYLQQCESGIIHLAAAIAERVVRRELQQAPQITLELLREALDLATGNKSVRIQLNPADYEKLREHAEQLVAGRSDNMAVEIQADDHVSPGGCIVQTEFGTIDQRLESRLDRIIEELL